MDWISAFLYGCSTFGLILLVLLPSFIAAALGYGSKISGIAGFMATACTLLLLYCVIGWIVGSIMLFML